MNNSPIPKLSPDQHKRLVNGLSPYEFALSEVQSDKIAHFLYLLYQWNTKANLTRIPEQSAIEGHILDSIIPFLTLQENGLLDLSLPLRLADVGSGGGLPGIPLSIFFPHWSVTLIESSTRKNTFLSTASSLLGLGLKIHPYRVEENPHNRSLTGAFDVVTARALAPLPLLAEYLLPLCTANGLVVALKSANIDTELQQAEAQIKNFGGIATNIISYGSDEGEASKKKRVITIKKEHNA